MYRQTSPRELQCMQMEIYQIENEIIKVPRPCFVFADLSQNMHRYPRQVNCLPCTVPGSRFVVLPVCKVGKVCLQHARPLFAKEKLRAQGLYDAMMGSPENQTGFGENNKSDLAGNAFPAAQIGVAKLILLSVLDVPADTQVIRKRRAMARKLMEELGVMRDLTQEQMDAIAKQEDDAAKNRSGVGRSKAKAKAKRKAKPTANSKARAKAKSKAKATSKAKAKTKSKARAASSAAKATAREHATKRKVRAKATAKREAKTGSEAGIGNQRKPKAMTKRNASAARNLEDQLLQHARRPKVTDDGEGALQRCGSEGGG